MTASPAGMFENHTDVGKVLHPGSVGYDAAQQTYTIAGSGQNMWFGTDAFQFAWKKASGDVTLTADISFLGKGVNEHRKAVLMIRESLEADWAIADGRWTGGGLIPCHYGEEQGRSRT